MQSPPSTKVSTSAAELQSAWSRLPVEYGIPEKRPTLAEAKAYCERLAKAHYENFSVATWFLPKPLRKHFYSIYAYCRISDDLGDEVGDPHLALALLEAWQRELDSLYVYMADRSQLPPRHPVFVALEATIRDCSIPHHEFSDLLSAFRQDQTVTRYQTFEDLLGYCKNSANPVGHLVLYICGYDDKDRQQLSDFTCTALQLANFWQDVAVDYSKGRIYLPLEDMNRFKVAEQDIADGRFTPQFRELMEFEVRRARKWFELGLPLVAAVDRELALDIELFSRGGLAILDAIEKQNFDVLKRRPVVSKGRKLALILRALMGKLV
jgi:squalene synthase HpnC